MLQWLQVSNIVTRAWSAHADWEDVVSRANGRRAYNAHRQFEAAMRRAEVIKRLGQYGMGRGVKAQIARELGVHPSTITRDVQATLFANRHCCSTCHRPASDAFWKKLAEEERSYFGINPLSAEGQAEISAREAIAEVLPSILADYGFFEDDNDEDTGEGGRRVVIADLVERVVDASEEKRLS